MSGFLFDACNCVRSYLHYTRPIYRAYTYKSNTCYRVGSSKKHPVPILDAQRRHPVPKLEAQKGTLSSGTSPVLPSMEVRGSRKLWALVFISLFVISLTSNNRQTKGWFLHRRVWQQTLSVWQQTSSRSGNRQIKGGSVIGLFLRADSTTEGLATVKQTVWQQTKPLSHCA